MECTREQNRPQIEPKAGGAYILKERDLEISLMPMQTTLYFYKGDYKLSHPWVVVVITGDCTYPAWNTAGV